MKSNIFAKLMTIIVGTTSALFLTSKNSAHAFTISSFSPIGFSDAVAGITGFEIEDFEDTTLIPGLTVEWTSPDLGPLNTLPATYNPNSQGFANNAWDGNLTLNNTRQGFYLATPISSTTTFNFANQPTSVGVGVSNLEFTGANSSTLIVNGIDFADFDDFIPPPLLGTSTRSIYIRLDADSNETINSIGIRGGTGDFLTFDRVAVGEANAQDIPEGSNVLALGAIALLGIFTLNKTKDKPTSKSVKVNRK